MLNKINKQKTETLTISIIRYRKRSQLSLSRSRDGKMTEKRETVIYPNTVSSPPEVEMQWRQKNTA